MTIDEYRTALGYCGIGRFKSEHCNEEIVQAIWKASQRRETKELDRYLMNTIQFTEHYGESDDS